MKIKRLLGLITIVSVFTATTGIYAYADVNTGNLDTIIKTVSDYYNGLKNDDGNYGVGLETETDERYEIAVRYAMSDKEASERIKNGGTVAANTLVNIVYVDKKTGEISSIYNSAEIKQLFNATAAKANNDWKTAYLNYLNQDFALDTDYDFALIDLNSDGIPELHLSGYFTASGDRICAYSNGKINELRGYVYGTSYVKGANLFSTSGGHMHKYYNYIYKLENGEFVLLHKGDYGAEDTANVKLDNKGNPIYTYTWDNKNLTKAEYDKLLYDYYDKFNPTSAGAGACDKAEIINKIKNYPSFDLYRDSYAGYYITISSYTNVDGSTFSAEYDWESMSEKDENACLPCLRIDTIKNGYISGGYKDSDYSAILNFKDAPIINNTVTLHAKNLSQYDLSEKEITKCDTNYDIILNLDNFNKNGSVNVTVKTSEKTSYGKQLHAASYNYNMAKASTNVVNYYNLEERVNK